jgi:hypothetical protein
VAPEKPLSGMSVGSSFPASLIITILNPIPPVRGCEKDEPSVKTFIASSMVIYGYCVQPQVTIILPLESTGNCFKPSNETVGKVKMCEFLCDTLHIFTQQGRFRGMVLH